MSAIKPKIVHLLLLQLGDYHMDLHCRWTLPESNHHPRRMQPDKIRFNT
jgi:hypothetical protein